MANTNAKKTTDKKPAAKKTPAKKPAAAAKKTAPAKKATPAKKTTATVAKKAAPAKKTTTAAAKKATPVKKTTTAAAKKATKAPKTTATVAKKTTPAKKVEVKKEAPAKVENVKVEAKKAPEAKKKISTNAILGIVFGSIAAVAVVVAIIIIAINAGKANVTRNRTAGDLKFYLPETFTAAEPKKDDGSVTYEFNQSESLLGTSVMVVIYDNMNIDQAFSSADIDGTYAITEQNIDGTKYKKAHADYSIFGITVDTDMLATSYGDKTYMIGYVLMSPTQTDKEIKDKFTNSLTFKDVKVEAVAQVNETK